MSRYEFSPELKTLWAVLNAPPPDPKYAQWIADMGKPLPKDPIEVGEIVGWRIWEVHERDVHGKPFDDGPRIRSWVQPCYWQPYHAMHDITLPFLDEGVGDYNKVGIYAYKTQNLCLANHSQSVVYSPPNLIWGSCYLWGAVIEHDTGYRAQHATIRGLDCYVDDDILRHLRQRYGVGRSPEYKSV